MSTINLNDAKALTKNWREVNQSITVNGHQANEIFPNAYKIDFSDLQAIMSTPGVGGMRIYFGYTDTNPSPDPTGNTFPMRVVLVATDSNGNDILHTTEPCGAFDFATPCPCSCDINSPLTT
jgi:hypothetical protein